MDGAPDHIQNRTPKKKEAILKSIVSMSNSVPGLVPATLAIILSFGAGGALAQAPAAAPAAPAPQTPAPTPPSPLALPREMAPPAAPVDPFPPADPKYFTASSPLPETVNAFLHVIWGYNQSLLWRVEEIQPTAAPGVSKVVVFVTTKAPDAKVNVATFYTTPDGKHAIGEGSGVVPFGAKPFADVRELLKEHANGASRGAASKDLELVEFADLQCPHCKEAQTTMDQIVKDFPKAHVVFQLLPLIAIHPSAFRAASYGVCVQQLSNDAFFKFADGVFETQDGLTLSTQETVLRAAAKRAGLDDATIAACADTEAIKDIVKADIKLAQDAGVDQTPLLLVNGRMLPLTGSITYDQIKQLIQYQATLDGVDSGATAETLTPKPAQPTLNTLPK
jgi:protein-disulfide isomerase